jgi:hypothetical protein
MDEHFFLFQDTGVRIYGTDSYYGMNLPDGTWALSDSRPRFESPCAAFLTACGASHAWVVQTTSPLKSNWKKWSRLNNAGTYWVDVFTLDEMNALG